MTPSGRRPASRWPVLVAVLLALLGGSAPSASVLAGAATVGTTASAQSGSHDVSGDGHASRPTQDAPHLQGTLTHPPHIAAHTADPLPLLPAGRNDQTATRGSVQPQPPGIAAAHLTHHSPRHGRAPPLRTGI
ncbi:hypothetical protein [Streptomyces albidus (ex Kaewkla and Franco 2022)]|uniref:hypothetical protein n=1 Tax=Streptomyces albidus (ex Kaewkla and Franco 2022) TaxID=722709 RepID=UPI0015EED136|nr:hypothetical protein [Streptomyces albidus (ex Kaewkla and Franco 2022)]